MIKIACREPDKNRFMAAVYRKPCNEISYFETEFSPGIMSKILGKDVKTRTYFLPSADLVEFLCLTGLDMAYLCFPWFEGRKWQMDENGNCHYVDGLIKKKGDIGSLHFPDERESRRFIEGFLEKAEGSGLGWIFALACANNIIPSVGMQDYYISLYEDPEFIDEFMDIYEERIVYPLMETVLEYSPDAVMLRTEVCYKDGLVMSPELAEQFVFKRMRRQLDIIRERGIPVILHSDGDNGPVMDRWVEMGISAIHPVENCGKFNIYDVKKKWGDKITLMGNIDLSGVLTQGMSEDVEKDTLEHLDRLSGGGGYICGSSHDIGDNVPFGNLQAMIRTVCSYRI